MDPRDFLQVAKSLLKVDNTANCRTAFNRSYYAAYNVAVCFIEGLKEISVKISKGPSGHGEVRRYLGNCGESDLEIAHQRLLNLSRVYASYYVINSLYNRLIRIFKLVLCDKHGMFCHI